MGPSPWDYLKRVLSWRNQPVIRNHLLCKFDQPDGEHHSVARRLLSWRCENKWKRFQRSVTVTNWLGSVLNSDESRGHFDWVSPEYESPLPKCIVVLRFMNYKRREGVRPVSMSVLSITPYGINVKQKWAVFYGKWMSNSLFVSTYSHIYRMHWPICGARMWRQMTLPAETIKDNVSKYVPRADQTKNRHLSLCVWKHLTRVDADVFDLADLCDLMRYSGNSSASHLRRGQTGSIGCSVHPNPKWIPHPQVLVSARHLHYCQDNPHRWSQRGFPGLFYTFPSSLLHS